MEGVRLGRLCGCTDGPIKDVPGMHARSKRLCMGRLIDIAITRQEQVERVQPRRLVSMQQTGKQTGRQASRQADVLGRVYACIPSQGKSNHIFLQHPEAHGAAVAFLARLFVLTYKVFAQKAREA